MVFKNYELVVFVMLAAFSHKNTFTHRDIQSKMLRLTTYLMPKL